MITVKTNVKTLVIKSKIKVKVRFKVIQGEGKAGGYLLKLAM